MSENKRSSFSGSAGFVLAAAGSAVGLGNIWRFPYLAAKNHGGLFILCYIILTLTFGFTLLTTEIAIGRKTKQSPLTAYGEISRHFSFLGKLSTLVPAIILPYYCVIGGWVMKYFFTYLTGSGDSAAADGYYNAFISSVAEPLIWFVLFLAVTSFVILCGVEKGIEKISKILMPILFLLIIGITVYTLTLSYTDNQGVTRTGLQGLGYYLLPDFKSITFKDFIITLTDAMGQLFFSVSVAMGVMITYGSYVSDKTNLMKAINQIEIFDTGVAILAGLMIVPCVYVFTGSEGMTAGPGLMFESLPKVFSNTGAVGNMIGALFFLILIFAALTSSVSIMEAIVSGVMDRFSASRKKSALVVFIFSLAVGIAVCLGYNKFYFELTLPNGTTAHLLDLLDYISNSVLMPLIALLTCIMIGWAAKPKTVIDEVTKNSERFSRKGVYVIMVKYIAPALLVVLLLQAVGLFDIG